jgi:pilus assembly protein Flp/PilA
MWRAATSMVLLASGVAEFAAAEKKLVTRQLGNKEKSMTKVLNLAKRFVADEEGAALIEYTVLLGIMLIAVITTIIAVGNWVGNKWTTLNSSLANIQ